jgi:hypothetical protein
MGSEEMRWLKNIVAGGLLLAAAVVTLGTLFSDHSAQYGEVVLPSGGLVHLPSGTVTVFLSTSGEMQDGAAPGTRGLAFQVIPAGGGDALPMSSAGGSISAEGTQRSEVIGEHGAIGKVDVPGAGEYRVVADSDVQPGTTSLKFGTNAAAALAAKWKLLAALVAAALLLGLIPVPRRKKRWQDDPETPGDAGTPTEWSNPRAPYAG